MLEFIQKWSTSKKKKIAFGEYISYYNINILMHIDI